MARKRDSKGRYNFLIDSAVYDKFSKLCDELGYVRGKQVELAMKGFIQEHNKERRER